MKKEYDLNKMAACITPNEIFTIKSIAERMGALGLGDTHSVLRAKINILISEGAITRMQYLPAEYQCNHEQIKQILAIHANIMRAKTAPRKKKVLSRCYAHSMPWAGAKMRGRPGDKVLMLGVGEK